jgi:hypothetical protein
LVVKLHATVQLDGLDISFVAIPPRDWLPPNMSLHRWNTTAEVPEQLLGVYDFKMWFMFSKYSPLSTSFSNFHPPPSLTIMVIDMV